MSNNIRIYYEDYIKFFPEKWKWEIDQKGNSNELFMRFRARKSKYVGDNADKLPYFDSIEKDANQFGLSKVTFTDFFGIVWKGEKGVHQYVGDPDYEQHLYYYDSEYEEYLVSDEYTQSNPPKGFIRVNKGGTYCWIDFNNITDIKYYWVLENHLFKDSRIKISYNGDIKDEEDYNDEWVFDIYSFGKYLAKSNKKELYEKFCNQVDQHLLALQNSDRDEERQFAPTHLVNEEKVFSDAHFLFENE